MSNAWYEVLSVLHLMAMLLLSQANLLLLPRTSADGHQPKVSEGRHLDQKSVASLFLTFSNFLSLFIGSSSFKNMCSLTFAGLFLSQIYS